MIAYAEVLGAVVVGLQGRLVRVEVALAQGLPTWNLVGLPDTQVAESRDRVRAAVASSGFTWPDHRITVGLSPASVPKRGSGLDLAIAAAVLRAGGQLPASSVDLRETLILGELGLDGRVRAVQGALASLLAAGLAGVRRAFVPWGNASEAALMPEMDVVPVLSLAHLVAALAGDQGGIAAATAAGSADVVGEADRAGRSEFAAPAPVDLADVRGQAVARRAVEVAAAGAHHLALAGRPGVGKTMLANALGGLLPDLGQSASLEVTALHLMSGSSGVGASLVRRPPWCAPHHGASAASLVGGGSQDRPTPGQISLAHRGVLFLDEAAEFDPHVLDSLRQPLESGAISIARSGLAVTLPAQFQLVMTTNPCPCGLWLDCDPGQICTCAPAQRRRYLARISGPLLDRVELQVLLVAPNAGDFAADRESAPESSAQVKSRVEQARLRAAERWGGSQEAANARVSGERLSAFALGAKAQRRLDALLRSGESARGVGRIHRVAWTLADLAGRGLPSCDDIDEAAALRGELAHALGWNAGQQAMVAQVRA